ncbi:MAG: formate hydrogenlyase [Methylococcaceae bacterium]|nr:formate hydrogenlyase [Methylococcaceae bacterium]
MELNAASIYTQTVGFLAAMIVFTGFVMLAQGKVITLINTFALQGLLLALITVVVAKVLGYRHLYISAGLTLALKAVLIPWLLRYLVIRMGLHRQVDPSERPVQLMLIGASLVVFSYYVTLPIVRLSMLETRNILAVSMATIFLGMLLMISRRQAVTHVLGFMTIENGLFFSAVVSTYGMPMVVELGIAFDVLVAAVLFGVFFFQIRESIDSLDVDQLNRLREER